MNSVIVWTDGQQTQMSEEQFRRMLDDGQLPVGAFARTEAQELFVPASELLHREAPAQPSVRKPWGVILALCCVLLLPICFVSVAILGGRDGSVLPGDLARGAIGAALAMCLLGASLVVFFLPAIVAARREHHQSSAIAALNLLLGWTFVGWVVALVWSLTAVRKDLRE